MPDGPDIRVTDNPDEQRYEVLVDGALGGFAQYRLRPGRIVFTHTEVDDAYEGHGLGSTLVRTALDDVRARGLLVTPMCPFVRAYIDQHPEYQDLVAPER
jgi:predicted GNAT family acetyltransferase